MTNIEQIIRNKHKKFYTFYDEMYHSVKGHFFDLKLFYDIYGKTGYSHPISAIATIIVYFTFVYEHEIEIIHEKGNSI